MTSNLKFRPLTINQAIILLSLILSITSGLFHQCNAQIISKIFPEFESKITGGDTIEDDEFGKSVDFSEDRVIVGARKDDDLGQNSGSAYIFERDVDNATWSQVAKIVASDSDGGQFGYSVSISGDRAIVGAPWNGTDRRSTPGAAYIFERDNNGLWSQVVRLFSTPRGNDYPQFGQSVSISGDYAIVGAWNEYDSAYSDSSGYAYIFERDTQNGLWSQAARLTALGTEDSGFGYSVSISGNQAIIGGSKEFNSSSSNVYIFEKDIRSGIWLQTAKLNVPDEAGDSVSISGDSAIVGATSNGFVSAYIFEKKTEGNTWSQDAKIIPSDFEKVEGGGNSVSIYGDRAVIGTPSFDNGVGWYSGSAYIFQREPDNKSWSQVARLMASDAGKNDAFGDSVSLFGDKVVVGTSWGSSSAYIYDLTQLITLGFDGSTSSIVNESESGYRIFVRLSLPGGGDIEEAVSVDVIDSGKGTAISDVDYVALNPPTLTFPAGSRNSDMRSIEVKILDDAILEEDKTIELELWNFQGAAQLGANRNHILKIIDNDQLSSLAFESATSSTEDESNSSHLISVKLLLQGSEGLREPLSVEIRDSGSGSATAGVDYVPFITKTLMFPTGSGDGLTRSFEIDIIQDTTKEWDETVEFELVNFQGTGSLGDLGIHTLNIIDDDSPEAQIVFVDHSATGANHGGSWMDAFINLQDALAVLREGDQVWVAAGTYTPDIGGGNTPGDRDATFFLPNGVGVYGGFDGSETEKDQRDIKTNITILSGDLNGDDGPNFINYQENSFHIVTVKPAFSSTTLDGFTITGVNADIGGAALKSSGGSGEVNITHCSFSNNQGVGISNSSQNMVISDCSFAGGPNTGIDTGSSCRISRCTFQNHLSGNSYRGRAIDTSSGKDLIITESTFINRQVEILGPARIINCLFLDTNDSSNSNSQLTIGGDALIFGCVFNQVSKEWFTIYFRITRNL